MFFCWRFLPAAAWAALSAVSPQERAHQIQAPRIPQVLADRRSISGYSIGVASGDDPAAFRIDVAHAGDGPPWVFVHFPEDGDLPGISGATFHVNTAQGLEGAFYYARNEALQGCYMSAYNAYLADEVEGENSSITRLDASFLFCNNYEQTDAFSNWDDFCSCFGPFTTGSSSSCDSWESTCSQYGLDTNLGTCADYLIDSGI